MNILIVEKSFQIRKRLIRLVSHVEGINSISIATTFEEMINHLSNSSFDLLITDFFALDLFTLNGISKIKNKYQLRQLIVLADFYSLQIRIKYLEHGIDYFLDKANESEKIPQIIEKLIRKNKPDTVLVKT